MGCEGCVRLMVMASSLTVVEDYARLAPLFPQGSECWADRVWFGEVQGEVQSFARAVFLFEGAGC